MRPLRTALTTGILVCGLAAPAVAAADPATPGPTPDPVPNPTHAPAPAAGPPAVDHDGLYAVGTAILPGAYSSAGPVDGGTCYWRRIGADDATLENALTKKPQVIVIEASDIAFKTRGCQPWQPTDATPPDQTPPWLGQQQLRRNLDILNGLAGQSGNGQLPAY